MAWCINFLLWSFLFATHRLKVEAHTIGITQVLELRVDLLTYLIWPIASLCSFLRAQCYDLLTMGFAPNFCIMIRHNLWLIILCGWKEIDLLNIKLIYYDLYNAGRTYFCGLLSFIMSSHCNVSANKSTSTYLFQNIITKLLVNIVFYVYRAMRRYTYIHTLSHCEKLEVIHITSYINNGAGFASLNLSPWHFVCWTAFTKSGLKDNKWGWITSQLGLTFKSEGKSVYIS